MLKVTNLQVIAGSKVLIDELNFHVKKGEILAFVGPSGVGKSTLFKVICGLEKPSKGTVEVSGSVGFIQQQGELWPHLSVMDNVSLALVQVKAMSKKSAYDLTLKLLSQLGLKDHLETAISDLSGGQRQRVAIARALAMDPEVLCFDEPTSQLDRDLSRNVALLIQSIAAKGKAVIVSSHDSELIEALGCPLLHLAKLDVYNSN